MNEYFGERLKLAAEFAGVEFSATVLARELRVSKQKAHCWMTHTEPRATMVFRIADTFHVDPRWLATGEGEMTPPPTGGSGLSAYEIDVIKRIRRARPHSRPGILAMVKTLSKAATVLAFVAMGTLGFNKTSFAGTTPARVFDISGSEYTLRRFWRFLMIACNSESISFAR